MTTPTAVDPSDLEGSTGRQARRITLWIARALSYFVYFYILVVLVILFMGFFLLLFGANPDAGFAEWVYRSMDRAMKPFRGIFTPIELGTTSGNEVESVFETSVLFAMFVYGMVGLAVSAFISWLSDRMRRLDRQEAALAEQARYDAEVRRLEAAAADARAAATGPSATTQPPAAPTPTPPTAGGPTTGPPGAAG